MNGEAVANVQTLVKLLKAREAEPERTVIRANRHTRHADFVKVLDALQKAGYPRSTLQTTGDREAP